MPFGNLPEALQINDLVHRTGSMNLAAYSEQITVTRTAFYPQSVVLQSRRCVAANTLRCHGTLAKQAPPCEQGVFPQLTTI